VKQNGKHRVAKKVRKIFNQILQPKPALSLVELLVALTILALLRTAGLNISINARQYCRGAYQPCQSKTK